MTEDVRVDWIVVAIKPDGTKVVTATIQPTKQILYVNGEKFFFTGLEELTMPYIQPATPIKVTSTGQYILPGFDEPTPQVEAESKKCTCGGESTGAPGHSSWCDSLR